VGGAGRGIIFAVGSAAAAPCLPCPFASPPDPQKPSLPPGLEPAPPLPPGARQAVQGQRHRRRPQEPLLPVRPRDCVLRGRPGAGAMAVEGLRSMPVLLGVPAGCFARSPVFLAPLLLRPFFGRVSHHPTPAFFPQPPPTTHPPRACTTRPTRAASSSCRRCACARSASTAARARSSERRGRERTWGRAPVAPYSGGPRLPSPAARPVARPPARPRVRPAPARPCPGAASPARVHAHAPAPAHATPPPLCLAPPRARLPCQSAIQSPSSPLPQGKTCTYYVKQIFLVWGVQSEAGGWSERRRGRLVGGWLINQHRTQG
jgi:hypothetical protein